VTIGDFSSVHSNSHISGYVEISEGVQVGAGCVVREHLHIAPWATLGMQSAVLQNITEEGQRVVGVPAHPMRARDAEKPPMPGA
jgi:UDP-3-O-[3-hydroxymyristoyl] glucosamine N-acyltransferase